MDNSLEAKSLEAKSLEAKSLEAKSLEAKSLQAKQLVDAIISDFPDHDPNTRPVHTIGIGVNGYFIASDVARSYCKAEHFRGQRVRASVRFSAVSTSDVAPHATGPRASNSVSGKFARTSSIS